MTSSTRSGPREAAGGRKLAESERLRREREAKALRENLLRRKAQARGRRDAERDAGATDGEDA